MRVLWLSFTAAGASKAVNNDVAGCGWIASLEDCIKQMPNITLAIGFFHNISREKFVVDGVHYYPVQKKYSSFLGKVVQRLSTNLYDVNPDAIKQIIYDFQPDVIHLFGTESGMSDVVYLTSIPVIVHLQGLVKPYLSTWFPKGMSQADILFHSSFRSLLFRRGYFFEYGLFKKRAEREDKVIQKAKYFFGRTNWDKNYVNLLKKEYTYFHCEEVIRPIFYNYQWHPTKNICFKIVTVINPQLYKGLEMVLETGKLLKNLVGFNFEWHLIGVDGSSELVSIVEKTIGIRAKENNIFLKGVKVGEELVSELMKSDVFIHPSHIDNSPNSVCEAMLLGMPVIAGYVGGISSLLTHQQDGLLYNSHDPYALASLIQNAFNHPEELASLGKAARVRAHKRHDWRTITDTVISAYETAIKETMPLIANPLLAIE